MAVKCILPLLCVGVMICLTGCTTTNGNDYSRTERQLKQADSLVTKAKLPAARQITTSLRREFPSDWQVWGAVVDFWLSHGHPEEAITVAREFEKRTQLFSQPTKLTNEQTSTLLLAVAQADSSASQASPFYSLALKYDPDNSMALNAVAYDLAERNQQLGRALTLSKKAVELFCGDNEDRGLYIDTLGWVYYRRGENTNAVRYLRQAAALCPNQYEIRCHLAYALLKEGDVQTAYVECRKALLLNRSSHEARSMVDRLRKDYKFNLRWPL